MAKPPPPPPPQRPASHAARGPSAVRGGRGAAGMGKGKGLAGRGPRPAVTGRGPRPPAAAAVVQALVRRLQQRKRATRPAPAPRVRRECGAVCPPGVQVVLLSGIIFLNKWSKKLRWRPPKGGLWGSAKTYLDPEKYALKVVLPWPAALPPSVQICTHLFCTPCDHTAHTRARTRHTRVHAPSLHPGLLLTCPPLSPQRLHWQTTVVFVDESSDHTII